MGANASKLCQSGESIAATLLMNHENRGDGPIEDSKIDVIMSFHFKKGWIQIYRHDTVANEWKETEIQATSISGVERVTMKAFVITYRSDRGDEEAEAKDDSSLSFETSY